MSIKISLLGTSHGDPTVTRLQSSTVIEVDGHFYLIDAGEGALRSLIQRGIGPENIEGIFITHMHLDHTGGLPEVLELGRKYRHRKPEVDPFVLLPDPEAGKVLCAWQKINNSQNVESQRIESYTTGVIFDDGLLKVEAYPTRHLDWVNGTSPRSYSFRLTVREKRIFFTGDLYRDFSDFAFDAANGCDVLISELVHFPPEAALSLLNGIKIGRLVFHHLGNRWQTQEGEQEILRLFGDVSYPVTVGYDGYSFEV